VPEGRPLLQARVPRVGLLLLQARARGCMLACPRGGGGASSVRGHGVSAGGRGTRAATACGKSISVGGRARELLQRVAGLASRSSAPTAMTAAYRRPRASSTDSSAQASAATSWRSGARAATPLLTSTTAAAGHRI